MSEVKVFEWVERSEPAYGEYGKVYMCYVSDMHIGSIRVVQEMMLTKRSVMAIMHKKTERAVTCEDKENPVGQGKAWIQSEFMAWYLAVNKLAWAYLRETGALPPAAS